jgi:DNA mismatch repair protein MutS
MHKVQQGLANQSYGIQVAQLAGVPRAVIMRAKEKLRELEQAPHHQAKNVPVKQQELFDIEPAVIAELRALNIDELSPKQALELLYQYKKSI